MGIPQGETWAMKILLDTNVLVDAALEAIVTRNPQDFENIPLQILTPAQLIELLPLSE